MSIIFEESEPFKDIEQELKSWDLKPVKGGGLYFRCEKYAHIEIQMSGNEGAEDNIDWNLVEGFIPSQYTSHVKYVNTTLKRFADYFRKLRNEEQYLSFIITDISYHPVDYRDVAYGWVTAHSLVNCFRPGFIPFDPKRVWRGYVDSTGLIHRKE